MIELKRVFINEIMQIQNPPPPPFCHVLTPYALVSQNDLLSSPSLRDVIYAIVPLNIPSPPYPGLRAP